MSYLRDWLVGKASVEEQGTHTMYWMPAVIFNQLPIKRWKHNRPPDQDRVREIRDWIETSKRVDGILYLACIDNELVCYESNHRREALKDVEELHNILVDMMWNATNDQVKAEFFRLNKAVSVPELFIDDQPEVRIGDLLAVVNGFCDNYGKLKSPNKNPHRPNFNRDTLLDDLYQIVKETKLPIDEIMTRIAQYNQELRSRDKSKLSKTVIEKCERTGLWVFAWKPRISAADIGL
jgi:hypothetical protein